MPLQDLGIGGGAFGGFRGRLRARGGLLGGLDGGIIDAEIMLGGLVAGARGATEPLYGFMNVLGNSAAGLITQTEVTLGGSAFLVGGGPIPADGLTIILG